MDGKMLFEYIAIHIVYDFKGQEFIKKAVADDVADSQKNYCGLSTMLKKKLPVTWEINSLMYRSLPINPLKQYFKINAWLPQLFLNSPGLANWKRYYCFSNSCSLFRCSVLTFTAKSKTIISNITAPRKPPKSQ